MESPSILAPSTTARSRPSALLSRLFSMAAHLSRVNYFLWSENNDTRGAPPLLDACFYRAANPHKPPKSHKLLVKLQSGRQFQILPHTSEIMGLEEAVDDAFCLKILVEEVVDRVPVELGIDLCALGVGGAVDGELLFDLAGARLVVLVEHAVRHKGILVTMDK